MAWVLKPWVATQNWVAAYFVVGRGTDNGSHGSHGSPTDLQYIFYIYNENIFDGVFFRKEIFFMRVIWVAGRTQRPIIGSLQKSRENPGPMVLQRIFEGTRSQ